MAGGIDLIGLNSDVLDIVMPISLVINPTGRISRVGRTLAKMSQGEDLVGQKFSDSFILHRPRSLNMTFGILKGITGQKLRVGFRNSPGIMMKGVLVEEKISGCLLLNLSFGFVVFEAVQKYGLTNDDFAQTDLTIEMLYLVEAKTAVMDESRRLNGRLQLAREEAEEQASTDVLTGLKNRRAMEQGLARMRDEQTPFGLMHLDLDYFKKVNDTFGHAAGDVVLQAAAKVLLEETREQDIVARVGGDEFALMFKGPISPEKLSKIAKRIVTRLEEPVMFEGNTCRISGSIGFTCSEFYEAPDLDQMLSHVDLALYESKDKGRACTTMVTPALLEKAQKSHEIMA